MSYVAPKYTPDSTVKMANSIPRFDYSTFAVIDANQFPEDAKGLGFDIPPKDDYIKGIATLPIAIMIAGFVFIVLLQITLFLRCCCSCWGCGPKEEDITSNPVKVIKSRNFIFYGFWFFIIVMLLADHLLYFGNADLSKGKENLVLSLTLLKGVFENVAASTATLITKNEDLQVATDALIAGVCNENQGYAAGSAGETGVQALGDAVTTMLNAFTSIDDLAAPLPEQIQSFIDSAEKFGDEYKNMGMYALYGFILAINILFAAGACLTSKTIMYLAFLIGEVVCIFSTIVCGIVMIIVTVYADFCMNPGQNMMNAMGPGTVSDMIEFFSTCLTENPFNENIEDVNEGLNTFADTITNTFEQGSSSCVSGTPSNACDCLAVVGDTGTSAIALSGMTSGINGVGAAVSCSAMNPVYDTFMNQAMCTNMFSGVWTIFLCASIASVCLFFLLAFGSVLWSYFGVAWKLQPDDEHTGQHGHLSGTNMEPTAVANYVAPSGYKEEYTFTAASPSAPALTRREIEMI